MAVGCNGGFRPSKTECVNQLAAAGTGERGGIYPLLSSGLWETGNHLL